MSSAESLSSIHQDLAMIINPDQDIELQAKVSSSSVDLSTLKRFRLKIKEADMKFIETSLFKPMGSSDDSVDGYLIFDAEVDRVIESAENMPMIQLRTFKQQLLSNDSLTMVK